MTNAKDVSRRNFLKASGVAAAAPYFVAAKAMGRDGEVAPSEHITMGAIGVGKRCANCGDELAVQLANAR